VHAALNPLAKAAGPSALLLAAKAGLATLVAPLVAAGAELEHALADGTTALVGACQSWPQGAATDEAAKAATVSALLAAGAKATAALLDGRTALHFAAAFGFATLVAPLAAAGADVEACGGEGGEAALVVAAKSADSHAGGTKRLATVEELLAAGASRPAALQVVAHLGRPKLLAPMLAGGSNADLKARHATLRMTALVLAVRSSVADDGAKELVVRMLLEAGADAASSAEDGSGGWTALHFGATFAQARLVELLAKAGAELDATVTGPSGKEYIMIPAVNSLTHLCFSSLRNVRHGALALAEGPFAGVEGAAEFAAAMRDAGALNSEWGWNLDTGARTSVAEVSAAEAGAEAEEAAEGTSAEELAQWRALANGGGDAGAAADAAMGGGNSGYMVYNFYE